MNFGELEVYMDLKKKGWKVLKRGYPDFFCYKGNRIKFVEVKRQQKRPTEKMGLSKSQREMIGVMRSAGLKVEVIYV